MQTTHQLNDSILEVLPEGDPGRNLEEDPEEDPEEGGLDGREAFGSSAVVAAVAVAVVVAAVAAGAEVLGSTPEGEGVAGVAGEETADRTEARDWEEAVAAAGSAEEGVAAVAAEVEERDIGEPEEEAVPDGRSGQRIRKPALWASSNPRQNQWWRPCCCPASPLE